jgi:hypothetical protein
MGTTKINLDGLLTRSERAHRTISAGVINYTPKRMGWEGEGKGEGEGEGGNDLLECRVGG